MIPISRFSTSFKRHVERRGLYHASRFSTVLSIQRYKEYPQRERRIPRHTAHSRDLENLLLHLLRDALQQIGLSLRRTIQPRTSLRRSAYSFGTQRVSLERTKLPSPIATSYSFPAITQENQKFTIALNWNCLGGPAVSG